MDTIVEKGANRSGTYGINSLVMSATNALLYELARPGTYEHLFGMERLSLNGDLQLYTMNAARISLQENDRGSIEVGELGDFVQLGEALCHIDPRKLQEIPVEMTVIGWHIVYP